MTHNSKIYESFHLQQFVTDIGNQNFTIKKRMSELSLFQLLPFDTKEIFSNCSLLFAGHGS